MAVHSSEKSSSLDFPVVALGASAGGIGPVQEFFEALSNPTAMAFVVIVHLAPDHSSHLADVLGAHTELPAQQITGDTPVEPGRVYVIPPGHNLSIRGGRFHLSELEGDSRERMPIDHFLYSLAQDQGPAAAGVIFSGTGSDGTLGLERVKEAGGLTLVQAPASSEHAGMPQSAIRTGHVDAVLEPRRLGEKLVDYFRDRSAIAREIPDRLSDQQTRALEEILTTVRARTDHDFSPYKRSTILRRIQRRLQVIGAGDLPAYRRFIQDHPDEATKLAKDFLISVTHFFREPAAFEALETTVVPELFDGRGPDEQVRVWVPGCATGEEAYSVAMLLVEEANRLAAAPDLQVFATDIDTDVLEIARQGLYPEAIAGDISTDRLERFFRKEEAGYVVAPVIRRLITFAEHNLLRDPPFSNLDFISCRNLLIYLDRPVQEKVFELFRFALRPKGFLLLGHSESAESASDLFSPADNHHSIYQRRAVESARSEIPDLPMIGHRSRRPNVDGQESSSDPSEFGPLHRQLIARRWAPPSVIVDEHYNIAHLAGGFGRYLRETDGSPSRNLLEKLPDHLRGPVRRAFLQVKRGRASRQVQEVCQTPGEEISTIRLTVEAIEDPEDFFLIVFEEIGSDPEGENASVSAPAGAEEENDAPFERLEKELRRTEEELRLTVEDYETSMEELKSSNEELESMNEELQSTTEELETSKEEHQSINEELTTVNEELSHKIDELSRANSDLKNLMEATEIGTVFVDNQQRIQRFTRPVTELFNLRSSDRGRPIGDITHRLEVSDLTSEIKHVVEHLEKVQREVPAAEDRWYIMRIRPYRSVDDKIEGAVLTFVDITARKQAEEALRTSEEKFRSIAENNLVGIGFIQDGTFQYVNPRYAEIYGYTQEELLGTSYEKLIHPEDRPRAREKIRQRLHGETEHTQYVFKGRRKDGETRFIEVYGSRGVHQGKPTIIGAIIDVTDRRRLQREILHIQEEERRRMGQDLHDGVASALSGIVMMVGSLQKVAREKFPELADPLTEIKALLQETGEGIRRISRGLNPINFQEGGLPEALSRLATNADLSEEMSCRLEADDPLPALSTDVATHLYWIAQEAVNNARKYAQADRLVIRLSREDGSLGLIVSDNGQGFDPDEMGEGMGLRTMKYRADLIGGTLSVESKLGEGATVRVNVPVG